MEKVIDINKTPKKKLVDLLKELRNTDERYILQANGSSLAIVMSQDEYEKHLLRYQAEAQTDMKKFLSKIPHGPAQEMPEDDLMKEIVDAIHEMRESK